MDYINLLKFVIFMVLLDFVWISFFMQSEYNLFFRKMNRKMKLNYPFVVVVYSLMALAYILLINGNNMGEAIRQSIIVGGIVYGIWAFTMGSIFEHYTFKMAIMETIWGMILFSSATYLSNLF